MLQGQAFIAEHVGTMIATPCVSLRLAGPPHAGQAGRTWHARAVPPPLRLVVPVAGSHGCGMTGARMGSAG
jgi:hypothetical protein